MTDDTQVPEDAAVAAAAQRALGRLADRSAPAVEPWAGVHARARRVRHQRVAVVGAACAIVLVVAGTATAIANGDGTRPARVAEAASTTTTTAATTTTETPSTAAAPPATAAAQSVTTPASSPPTLPPGFADLFKGEAPGVGDVSGAITLAIEEPANLRPLDPGSVVPVGSRVEVSADIRNITDHSVIAGCACRPTSFATICTSSSSGNQTLWWMTNFPMAPGDTDGRGGTIATNTAYLGTVTCELDVVTTDMQGTRFDTGAGGDTATATVVGRVTQVAPVTFTVVAVPASTTTTTTTQPETTTTTVAPTPTT